MTIAPTGTFALGNCSFALLSGSLPVAPASSLARLPLTYTSELLKVLGEEALAGGPGECREFGGSSRAGLGACMGRTPQPVAVIQPQDQFMDCTAIYAETQANNAKATCHQTTDGRSRRTSPLASLASLSQSSGSVWTSRAQPIRRPPRYRLASNTWELWRCKSVVAARLKLPSAHKPCEGRFTVCRRPATA